MDTDESREWDVESYRGTHESVEHWELRKQFMIENKGKFPEVRLVCLSQVFANMEFLGCRYPLPTMELVTELSQGIIEDYREKQKGRLQRTFVKASDAAEKKSKGQKRSAEPVPQTINKIFVRESHTEHSLISVNNVTSNQSSNIFKVDPEQDLNLLLEHNLDISAINQSARRDFSPFERESVHGLVIVEHPYSDKSPVEILFRSCGMSHKECKIEYTTEETDLNTGAITCIIHIGHFSEKGKGFSKDGAKLKASKNTLNSLKCICYTIQVKKHISDNDRQVGKGELANVKDKPISEDNIGNKLLRLMGWGGGGLGKNNQGREDIIDVSNCIGRSKMGLGSTSFSAKAVKAHLTKEIQENGINELVFSSEFTSDERKVIHTVANQLDLKSRSYGKGDNRFLVLSRKIQLIDLVREILQTGETDKYRVINPTLF